MHILILPSWYPTADDPISGCFFREQAQQLMRHDIEAGVIVPRMHPIHRIPRIDLRSLGLTVENDGGLPTYRYDAINISPGFHRGRVWLLKQVGIYTFKRYVADHGLPDILHAHSALYGAVLGTQIKSIYHIPLVVTEHSTAYARNKLTRQQHKIANAAFSASDRLISVSPQLGELLSTQFPTVSKEWTWIPNTVDVSFLQDNIGPRRHKPPGFVFLNVALMTEKKGQKDLLSAFAHHFRGQSDVELWIGGDGPMRSALETQASILGIAAQVKFMGMLDRVQVREAMATADAFVLSSHYETFGVVLIEALALGKPVIATRCGGPVCIVSQDDGLLVPRRDVEALGNALVNMRENIGRYHPDRIRASCYARFGEDAVITQLKAVYAEVLSTVDAQTFTGSVW